MHRTIPPFIHGSGHRPAPAAAHRFVPPSSQRRRAWLALGAAAAATSVLSLALATAGPAAAATGSAPTAPPVTILTGGSGQQGGGDIFISPFGDSSTYLNGPEILSPQGSLIWFHPVPAGQEASDFRAQVYDGHPVLTWWQGTGLASGTESEQPLPASASTPLDWFHINAVHLAADGNLLIDARNTWTTYKANRRTGAVIWQLGGKRSSFTLHAASGQTLDNAGELFAWQHDPEQIGPDEFTFFDNEASNTAELPYSRAIVVRLDEQAKTATIVSSYNQPEGLSAPSQGNAQALPNRDLFVGWGSLPYFSQFSPSGDLVLRPLPEL